MSFEARMTVLRERFQRRTRDKRAYIAAALEAMDLERLTHASHHLAGSAGIFGFPEISRAAERLETSIRNRQSDADLRLLGAELLQSIDVNIP